MLQVVAMPRKIFASMYLFSFLSYSVRYFKREHDSGSTFFKQPILYLVTNQGSNRKLHTPKSIDIYWWHCMWTDIFSKKQEVPWHVP